MESFSEDVIEVYHSLYQSAKTIEVKAPKKILLMTKLGQKK